MTTFSASNNSITTGRFDSIDLAKTIAVLAVFAYHLPSFPLVSGFLGVDLFLVVTGYLTASSTQRAGPIVFFVKRLIRVWPSLIIALLLTFFVFQYFMYYSEIRQLSRDSVLANSFLANFGTYYLTGGYFDRSTQSSPLFHLWSISLEIQLWFIFALILLITRKHCFRTIACFGLVSFCYSALIMVTSADINEFYLLPIGRFWEAALGYCVFFQPGRIRLSNSTLLAIVIVLITIMFMDVNEYRVLWYVYVLFSAAILNSEIDLGAHMGAFVKFFSRRTYGIYLIHVPLIILFNKYLQLNVYLSLFSVVVFTVIYANLSYRYLET